MKQKRAGHLHYLRSGKLNRLIAFRSQDVFTSLRLFFCVRDDLTVIAMKPKAQS